MTRASVFLILLAVSQGSGANFCGENSGDCPGRSQQLLQASVKKLEDSSVVNDVSAVQVLTDVKQLPETMDQHELPSYTDDDWDDWEDGGRDSDPNDDGDWDADEDNDEWDKDYEGWGDDKEANDDDDAGDEQDDDADGHDADEDLMETDVAIKKDPDDDAGDEQDDEEDVVFASAAKSRRELRRKIAPGCYVKQQVSGFPSWQCPASKQWVQDTWGRNNANSFASKAKCQARKEGHDKYCGSTGSRWRFVRQGRTKGKQPPPPAQPGCYFRMPPAPTGHCTEIKDWTLDSWGRDNAKSFESKASCEARKQGHDSWCRSTVSQWLYVSPPAGQRNSVLCIGNSLTFTIFHVLQDAFTQGRTGLSFKRITTGGRKLNEHKKSLKQGEWHYKDAVSAEKWKYVVLQEAGYMPWRHSYKHKTFKKSLKAVLWWDKKIQELGADTVIYEPLGRRDGTRNMRSAKGRKLDFKAYYRATKKGVDNYVKALKKRGRTPKHAPVGTAFMIAHIQNYDLWYGLYDQDGTHPSPRGQYLASCVLFATISGQSPKSLPLPSMASSYRHYADWENNVLRPAYISAQDGAMLRDIAHKAVFG